MGGDEFALILPTESTAAAEIVARELLADDPANTPPKAASGRQPGQVTASIGLAAFEGHLSAEEMLVRADRAMYNAKASGRDRYALYTDVPSYSTMLSTKPPSTRIAPPVVAEARSEAR